MKEFGFQAQEIYSAFRETFQVLFTLPDCDSQSTPLCWSQESGFGYERFRRRSKAYQAEASALIVL